MVCNRLYYLWKVLILIKGLSLSEFVQCHAYNIVSQHENYYSGSSSYASSKLIASIELIMKLPNLEASNDLIAAKECMEEQVLL